MWEILKCQLLSFTGSRDPSSKSKQQINPVTFLNEAFCKTESPKCWPKSRIWLHVGFQTGQWIEQTQGHCGLHITSVMNWNLKSSNDILLTRTERHTIKRHLTICRTLLITNDRHIALKSVWGKSESALVVGEHWCDACSSYALPVTLSCCIRLPVSSSNPSHILQCCWHFSMASFSDCATVLWTLFYCKLLRLCYSAVDTFL